jgi:hypothetical protein
MIIVKVFMTGRIAVPVGSHMLSAGMEYYLYLLIGYVKLSAGIVDK